MRFAKNPTMKRYIFIFWGIVALLSCKKEEPKLQEVKSSSLFYKVKDSAGYQKDTIHYPLNVVLMIGDGMGLAQIYAAMTVNRGNLHLKRCKYIGLCKTNSEDNYITDSAAGATAYACGKKTKNGAIAVDTAGRPIPTILEIAAKEGLSTGLVTTCAITHATPAAFVAHQVSREMYEEIAADFLKVPITLFIGGGLKHFQDRKDKQDLTAKLAAKGYQIVLSEQQLDTITQGKFAALLAENHLPSISKGRNPEWLKKATRKALTILSQNPEGFFLMIEGSQIDWGGHNNDLQYVVDEMLDFDQAVGEVLDFADKTNNTLVIVTADHETGGLTLNGGSLIKGEVHGTFTSHDHTAVPVPVFAYGVGAEEFSGFYENTAVFDKIVALLGFNME
ncbi:MAG: alkaline phosphatase [Cytophagales bacterium]|nr:alkaline phosphatase [Cytophagales bacterium]MDW8383905.1 alkaline phosphatase [Flammeovirgaceae bacterium]